MKDWLKRFIGRFKDDGSYYFCGICGWVPIWKFPYCH